MRLSEPGDDISAVRCSFGVIILLALLDMLEVDQLRKATKGVGVVVMD